MGYSPWGHKVEHDWVTNAFNFLGIYWAWDCAEHSPRGTGHLSVMFFTLLDSTLRMGTHYTERAVRAQELAFFSLDYLGHSHQYQICCALWSLPETFWIRISTASWASLFGCSRDHWNAPVEADGTRHHWWCRGERGYSPGMSRRASQLETSTELVTARGSGPETRTRTHTDTHTHSHDYTCQHWG